MSDWVKADLATHLCPRVETSVLCRLRQLVEVQGDESHAEAGEEDDQVLTGDGHNGQKAHSLRNVMNMVTVDKIGA